jgi:Ca2+-binding RTX toxin-like protein
MVQPLRSPPFQKVMEVKQQQPHVWRAVGRTAWRYLQPVPVGTAGVVRLRHPLLVTAIALRTDQTKGETTMAQTTIPGTPFDDVISASAIDDVLDPFNLVELAYFISGGDGHDQLSGDSQDDSILGGDGNDALFGAQGNDSLLGGSGNDVLRGGEGNDDCRGGTGADTVSGNGGNDSLFGEAGNDVLNGGEGNDALLGGTGRDMLTGGAGSDIFRWNAASESGVGNGSRDVVTDFVRGADLLHLDSIDANTNVTGNQDFGFIGTLGFTAAGQVRYLQFNGNTVVQLETNGDGVPDMEIQLTGTFNLAASDFNL